MVYYFAQNATIKAKKSDGTYETVGAAQEVSFEWNVDATDLYGFGTIKRLDAARSNLSVNVTVNFAKFGNVPSVPESGTAPTGDWFWKLINAAGWTQVGSTQEMNISTSDTSVFPMFEISGEFRPTDGDTDNYIYATAHDVYFTSFQWGGSLGEYIMENIEGKASDITYSNTAPTGFNP